MAGKVLSGGKAFREEGDIAKTLHGVTQVPLYLIQCVDGRGKREVVLALQVNDNFYAFPPKTWDSLGVIPGWLSTLVNSRLNPKSVAQMEQTFSITDKVDVEIVNDHTSDA